MPLEESLGAVPDGGSTVVKQVCLVVLSGPDAGQTIDLSDETTTLGRDPRCHMVFTDLGVSRMHAELVNRQDGTFGLRDLGSSNGTFVDEERVEEVLLKDGDRFRMGPTTLLRLNFLYEQREERLPAGLGGLRDPLTGIYNRMMFEERLQEEFAFAKRHQSALSVLMIDVDNFKHLNDTHGARAGDCLLIDLVQRMYKTLRTEDFLARHGPEEFAVLLRAIDTKGAMRLAERVRQRVALAPFRIAEPLRDEDEEDDDEEELQSTIAAKLKMARITISVGVATFNPDHPFETTHQFVHQANDAMERAKAAGRNQISG